MTTVVTTIRPFDPHRDRAAVRALLVELQDYERAFEPRLPPGATSADDYFAQLMEHCTKQNGDLHVATQHGGDNQAVDGLIVGFVGVMTRAKHDDPSQPQEDFAYVSDLIVAADARGRGVGQALLDEAVKLARASGVSTLEIGVLAKNANALSLYERNGFSSFMISMVKRLAPSST